MVDPATGRASAIDLPGSMLFCGMSGKAVDEQTLGMCLPASTHCLNLTLHHSNIHQLPRFAELVAALVSYWVHTDEQEPPQIEHAAMHAHLELLSEAKKHRTWRIIFTGHSLGGMYAAVLLFKRSRRRWDRRMLVACCLTSMCSVSPLALRWFSVAAPSSRFQGLCTEASDKLHQRERPLLACLGCHQSKKLCGLSGPGCRERTGRWAS